MRSTIALFVIVFAVLGLLLGFAQSYDGTLPNSGHRLKASGGFMSGSPSAQSDADELLEEGVLYRDDRYGAIYFTRVFDATLGTGGTTRFEYEDIRPDEYQNAKLHAFFIDENYQPFEISTFEDSTFEKSMGSISMLGAGYISIPDNHASGALRVESHGSGMMLLHVRIFSVYDKSMLGSDVDLDKLPPRPSDAAMDDVRNVL